MSLFLIFFNEHLCSLNVGICTFALVWAHIYVNVHVCVWFTFIYVYMPVNVWDWCWNHPKFLLHTIHWDKVSQSHLIWPACSGDLDLLSRAWITSGLQHPLYLLKVTLSFHDNRMQEEELSSLLLQACSICDLWQLRLCVILDIFSIFHIICALPLHIINFNHLITIIQ